MFTLDDHITFAAARHARIAALRTAIRAWSDGVVALTADYSANADNEWVKLLEQRRRPRQ
jgi:hypothetical protein